MKTTNLSARLETFARLNLIETATPLQRLSRLSARLGRDIYVKRDDFTSLAMGGNKLRKLEFLAADAIRQKADVLVTAGAIQSNHVRQTAALAAQLGLECVALLENPIGTDRDDYLRSGNRLLLDLFAFASSTSTASTTRTDCSKRRHSACGMKVAVRT